MTNFEQIEERIEMQKQIDSLKAQNEKQYTEIDNLKSIISDFMVSLNQSGPSIPWNYDPHINAAWERGAKIFRK